MMSLHRAGVWQLCLFLVLNGGGCFLTLRFECLKSTSAGAPLNKTTTMLTLSTHGTLFLGAFLLEPREDAMLSANQYDRVYWGVWHDVPCEKSGCIRPALYLVSSHSVLNTKHSRRTQRTLVARKLAF